MPSPKNNRKGANQLPPNAPRKPSLLGRIGGAIKYGAGAALGGIAHVGQRSAQRGFNLTGFKTRTNPTYNKNKNKNTTQSNVNAAREHREPFGN